MASAACRQTVRFLPPAQVIRYLNDRNAEAVGDALEGSMRVHVPFGGVKTVLDVLGAPRDPVGDFSSASIIGARVPAAISGFSASA